MTSNRIERDPSGQGWRVKPVFRPTMKQTGMRPANYAYPSSYPSRRPYKSRRQVSFKRAVGDLATVGLAAVGLILAAYIGL